MIEHPWNLLARNPARIQTDIEMLWPQHSVPDGSILIGDGPVSLGSGAEVEPGIVFDTRQGPIRLAENTRVEGPARLTGPLFIGPKSVIHGGRVGTSSIGPVCHLHGEVSDSVFIGFSNKSHSGYIGHSLVGRWVNLGAFTTNSDLKNNYGPVRVWTPEGYIDTGQIKVGCFLGDHVKTGIGMTLNTGTVVGAGSNLFGNAMPSSKVPAFSWGSGEHLARHRLPEFLATAKQVMARRKIELTPGVVRILEKAWERTAERLAE
jgi:UDP-N-acetylglucosamine diphosphorylase/glucosamine-1-phosphate N-acetyltransferase